MHAHTTITGAAPPADARLPAAGRECEGTGKALCARGGMPATDNKEFLSHISPLPSQEAQNVERTLDCMTDYFKWEMCNCVMAN